MTDSPRRPSASTAPAANRLDPDGPLTDEYRSSILNDQRARGGGIPIQNRRLLEIPRHLLRVSCRRCDLIVEIQTADAIRLYSAHAIWKDVGGRLLDTGCQQRTGNRDSDGCWFVHVALI